MPKSFGCRRRPILHAEHLGSLSQDCSISGQHSRAGALLLVPVTWLASRVVTHRLRKAAAHPPAGSGLRSSASGACSPTRSPGLRNQLVLQPPIASTSRPLSLPVPLHAHTACPLESPSQAGGRFRMGDGRWRLACSPSFGTSLGRATCGSGKSGAGSWETDKGWARGHRMGQGERQLLPLRLSWLNQGAEWVSMPTAGGCKHSSARSDFHCDESGDNYSAERAQASEAVAQDT